MRKLTTIIALIMIIVASLLVMAASRSRGVTKFTSVHIANVLDVLGEVTFGNAKTDTLQVYGVAEFDSTLAIGTAKPAITYIDTNNTKQLLIKVGGKLFTVTAADTSTP